jgi:hypothetical protein
MKVKKLALKLWIFKTSMLLALFAFLVLTGCKSVRSSVADSEEAAVVVGDPLDNLRYDYAGSFTGEDLNFLRETFNWKRDVLVINYTLPEDECKIVTQQPKDLKLRYERARIWWDPFYENMDTMDSRIVHVEADERFGKAFGSYSSQYYWDEKGFLLDHFYRNARGCEAVLVVNQQGEFYQQNNHYTQEQVAYYIARLKSQLPKVEEIQP